MTEASGTPGTPAAPPLPASVLEGARRGDPAALGELFEACFDDIYGLAARMLGDATQPEDAAQTVKKQQAANVQAAIFDLPENP